MKEEELRLKKVALNISKDVKKFWTKIEKLVFYKNQLELEERKKKALDKQLDFLLGQTERYSTMLAENLVDVSFPQKQENGSLQTNQRSQQEVAQENINASTPNDVDNMETDDDYNSSLGEEPVDDERMIDEDEAQITEAERNEELAALQVEADLPLDDILKLYTKTKVSRESSPDSKDVFSVSDSKNLFKDSLDQANGYSYESDHTSSDEGISSEEEDDNHSYSEFVKKNNGKCNGNISSVDEQEDRDYVVTDEGKDDEATLSEEEELAKKEHPDPLDEIKLLHKESEIPLKELLVRYQKDGYADDGTTELEKSPTLSVEDVNTNMALDDQSAEVMKVTRDQSAEIMKVNKYRPGEIVEVNNDAFEDHKTTDMVGPEHVSGSVLQVETLKHTVQESTVKEDEATGVKVMANGDNSDNVIADATAAARSAQPTGNTFSTTNSHQEFKDWFCNPISGMVEGQDKVNNEVIDRLHNVLRPFILRRLKRDVEKQLPKKHEHVIYCRLSRRQRNLYEDFIANSETQATLASGNYFGMISIIMQLRKVCNHPDLFEGRPIISSFDMAGINMQISSSVSMLLDKGPFSQVDLPDMNFVFTQNEFSMTSWEVDEVAAIFSPSNITSWGSGPEISHSNNDGQRNNAINIFEEIQNALWEERIKEAKERAASIAWWNRVRCQRRPVYGTDIREILTIKHPVFDVLEKKNNPLCHMDYSSSVADLVLSSMERFKKMLDFIESFTFAIPAARVPTPFCWCNKGNSPVLIEPAYREKCMNEFSPILSPIRPAIVRRQVYFPDRRLIQFDCGKLQELAILLRRLKAEGHRALIFTQMTKMLDILEEFINLYGGGVGINLVGADTVIFYDSDWNPAMDQQAQDRCHRIGQTREVHIYRLISESTIEENILKKANQKRTLDDLVIQRGSYNTEFFKKLDPMEFFSGHSSIHAENQQKDCSMSAGPSNGISLTLSNVDVEAAIRQAEDEADYMALKKLEQEEAVDNQEFSEEVAGRIEDDDFVNEEDANLMNRPMKNINISVLMWTRTSIWLLLQKQQVKQLNVEEEEWELERIEKLKEDLEAEIDEDQEPLSYETWDVDFATKAYHQHVEALTQKQLLEEQEKQAREAAKELEEKK
ncbi:hypothetical protein GUJ93_ZPchr0006g41460 [Zizania palustris]|uniref:Helicase C-terminal domain-containing protein n=1 Tax=Zizania palustris TaxID=103762 RepID=A0A8J5VM58_ZIZPA|nr:hypothetical protein GUJ93_ZPchr0006g41460 [Zizania palustris]KAG8071925.1 hypothetical protein GUJ93_ZPchr0006g41460 [Zizania palustris]